MLWAVFLGAVADAGEAPFSFLAFGEVRDELGVGDLETRLVWRCSSSSEDEVKEDLRLRLLPGARLLLEVRLLREVRLFREG